MEIGSFIELELSRGKEYYKGDTVIRLNTGRAAIWHAFKSTGCTELYLPIYQCNSVREFLESKGVKINFYNIDTDFTPIISTIPENAAILIVNYFGIFSNELIQHRISKYKNVIIDNCPAFYSSPIDGAYNVYSTRKFFGVPDGAYLIGNNILSCDEYEQDYSSDTSAFLLKRIEYGCEGKVYSERTQNELRLDQSDALIMSKLTHRLLDGIDYENIVKIRKANFRYACSLFDEMNEIKVRNYDENSDAVPMVYPLLLKDNNLHKRLLDGHHYQGHWWNYILNFPKANHFEKYLSRYMVPITIDQRYGIKHLDYIKSIVNGK